MSGGSRHSSSRGVTASPNMSRSDWTQKVKRVDKAMLTFKSRRDLERANALSKCPPMAIFVKVETHQDNLIQGNSNHLASLKRRHVFVIGALAIQAINAAFSYTASPACSLLSFRKLYITRRRWMTWDMTSHRKLTCVADAREIQVGTSIWRWLLALYTICLHNLSVKEEKC